jgi:hypothetical protein
MQTIALICTDDTGEGVLEKPEEPDERFDDMTLIGELAWLVSTLASSADSCALRYSLPPLRRIQLDRAVSSPRRLEEAEMAPLPRRRKAIDQEAASQVRRRHRHLVSCAVSYLFSSR